MHLDKFPRPAKYSIICHGSWREREREIERERASRERERESAKRERERAKRERESKEREREQREREREQREREQREKKRLNKFLGSDFCHAPTPVGGTYGIHAVMQYNYISFIGPYKNK